MLRYVGSEILTAIIMESTISRDVTPLRLCLVLTGLLFYPEDASSMVFRNVCELLPNCTADSTLHVMVLQNVYNPITTGMFEK
jgi:hypothetical protein